MSYRFCWLLDGNYLLLWVQYWNPDDGQKTCPKHAEFYSKNKFEKLVHLFGFSIRNLYGLKKHVHWLWISIKDRVCDFQVNAVLVQLKLWVKTTLFFRSCLYVNPQGQYWRSLLLCIYNNDASWYDCNASAENEQMFTAHLSKIDVLGDKTDLITTFPTANPTCSALLFTIGLAVMQVWFR
jgi:hypothetical protein